MAREKGRWKKRKRKRGRRRRKRGKEKEEEKPKNSSRNFRAQFSLVGIFHRSCPACCGESEIKLSYSIADKTFEKFWKVWKLRNKFSSELHFARNWRDLKPPRSLLVSPTLTHTIKISGRRIFHVSGHCLPGIFQFCFVALPHFSLASFEWNAIYIWEI